MNNWEQKRFTEKKKDTEDFNLSIAGDALELAIEWISDNLEIDDVFSNIQIIEWVTFNFAPANIFSAITLDEWARENGYIKNVGEG